MAELGIWEPLAVKAQTYKTAVEVYTIKAFVSSLIMLCLEVMNRITIECIAAILRFSTDAFNVIN